MIAVYCFKETQAVLLGQLAVLCRCEEYFSPNGTTVLISADLDEPQYYQARLSLFADSCLLPTGRALSTVDSGEHGGHPHSTAWHHSVQ